MVYLMAKDATSLIETNVTDIHYGNIVIDYGIIFRKKSLLTLSKKLLCSKHSNDSIKYPRYQKIVQYSFIFFFSFFSIIH